MKKTPLKRKVGLKHGGKLRKESKQPISVIQRKLWVLCREIIRKRHGNVCYTCGKKGLQGSDWQTGHLWAKAALGANLKYDLRVLRPQCYHCNINLGGAGADFWVNMVRENGETYMDFLKAERWEAPIKAYDHYVALIPQYQEILARLSPTGMGGEGV